VSERTAGSHSDRKGWPQTDPGSTDRRATGQHRTDGLGPDRLGTHGLGPDRLGADGLGTDRLGPDRLATLARLLPVASAAARDTDQLVRLAGEAVPHSEHVCVVVARSARRCETVGFSDPIAAELGAAQTDVGEGPGLEPVEGSDVMCVDDLRRDRRWPRFAAEASRHGMRSLLAARTSLVGADRASLLIFSSRPQVFTPADLDVAVVLGGLVGAALYAHTQGRRAENLAVALDSSRQIGIAIGILMARELTTPEEAFERLRAESQRRHRKLRDIADEVVRTGQLEIG
jgi:hypothetical protein